MLNIYYLSYIINLWQPQIVCNTFNKLQFYKQTLEIIKFQNGYT